MSKGKGFISEFKKFIPAAQFTPNGCDRKQDCEQDCCYTTTANL